MVSYLAIVNNATENMDVHMSFQIHVFVSSDEYPEVELLDHMAVLFLILGRGGTSGFLLLEYIAYVKEYRVGSSISGRCVNGRTTQMRAEASCSELAVARESANTLSLEDTQSPAEE